MALADKRFPSSYKKPEKPKRMERTPRFQRYRQEAGRTAKARACPLPALEPEEYPAQFLQPVREEEAPLFREPMPDGAWQRTCSMLRDRLSQIGLDSFEPFARRIEERIRWLDATMTRYCNATCPACEDACCTGREIFYNRADLITLVALGRDLPPGQTRSRTAAPCRYLGPNGCHLPRSHRPYVCVWFLCEPQMALLSEEPVVFQRDFIRIMQEVRKIRLRLESLYEYHFAD